MLAFIAAREFRLCEAYFRILDPGQTMIDSLFSRTHHENLETHVFIVLRTRETFRAPVSDTMVPDYCNSYSGAFYYMSM